MSLSHFVNVVFQWRCHNARQHNARALPPVLLRDLRQALIVIRVLREGVQRRRVWVRNWDAKALGGDPSQGLDAATMVSRAVDQRAIRWVMVRGQQERDGREDASVAAGVVGPPQECL